MYKHPDTFLRFSVRKSDNAVAPLMVLFKQCPYAYGTGFAACNRSNGAQRRTTMRFFCAQRSGSNGGLSGAAFGLAGSVRPVLRTLLSPPPLDRSRGRRVTTQLTESSAMSAITPKGTPPEIRPFPTCEILQGILCELEAAADLVEQLLTHGNDQAILDTVIQSLGAMADMLKGGCHE